MQIEEDKDLSVIATVELKKLLPGRKEKSYWAKECLNVSFGHLVHALMVLHMTNP